MYNIKYIFKKIRFKKNYILKEWENNEEKEIFFFYIFM